MARREKKAEGPEKIAKDLLALAVDIDSLTVDPKNARDHGQESINALRHSLSEYGQQKVIVFDPKTRVVTAGNGTLLAARALGWRKIAASGFDGPPEKIGKFAVADNATQDLSAFNVERLKIELGNFSLGEMTLLGLTDFHLHTNPGTHVVNPAGEWSGMPEFHQDDKTAFRSIVVHFKDQEALDEFLKVTKMRVTEATRFLWYPEIEIETMVDKRYDAEDAER